MHLAQGGLEAREPVLVEVAEPGIAEAVGMAGLLLLPEEIEGDVRTCELATDLGPIGLGPGLGRQIRRGREEQRLEAEVIIEFRRQGPAQAGATGAAEIFADRALAQAEAFGDGLLREAIDMVQAQQFTKVA